VQVLVEADGVHPAPEHLGVLGLFETELGQVHLVAEPAGGGHGLHERLDVLRHRFLTGDELRAEVGRGTLLVGVEGLPVRGVAAEVDVGGVPELGVSLDEQAKREGIPVQPALAQRLETRAVLGDGAGHVHPSRVTPLWTV
jgi:hypothetical protein